MNTSNLTFTANDQELVKDSGMDEYASNTVSYIKATFTLGTNWSGFDSVRAVWSSYYNVISTVLDTNNSCMVPAEMLLHKSKVQVNLVGSIVEGGVLTDRLTTFPVEALKVSADAKVSGSETAPVTPSQFEQFVESVEAAAQSVTDYSYDSEAWAKGTRGGTAVSSSDPTYHNNSKYWSDQGAALSQEVTNLKSEFTHAISHLGTHKVAQPLDGNNQPTYGTEGQSLRTKGDGTTEWADVGLPTDAQTAQAVSDWLDDHPEATTTVQDGSLTEAKFTDALKLKTIRRYITPDDFTGSDAEKVQSAFDSLVDTGGVLVLDRMYDIDESITINLQSDASDSLGRKKRTHVLGLGKNAGFNITASFGFVGSVANCGGIFFNNVRFLGSNSSGTIVFDTSYLIRLFFTQCVFDKFDGAFQSLTEVMQDIHCSQCYFKNVSIVLRSYAGIWAIGFAQCVVENGDKFIVTDANQNGTASNNISIFGCVIEGMTDSPLLLQGTIKGCVIDGCYFEANGTHDISVSGNGTVTVNNCYFGGVEGQGCILLPTQTSGSSPALSANGNKVAHGSLVDNTGAIAQFVDVGHHDSKAFLNNTPDKTFNINATAKRHIHEELLFTSNTAMADTGLSVTIPPYSSYVLTAIARYWSNPPTAVLITTNNDVIGGMASGNVAGSVASATISGYTDGGFTARIFASYSASAENQVMVDGFIQSKLPANEIA